MNITFNEDFSRNRQFRPRLATENVPFDSMLYNPHDRATLGLYEEPSLYKSYQQSLVENTMLNNRLEGGGIYQNQPIRLHGSSFSSNGKQTSYRTLAHL